MGYMHAIGVADVIWLRTKRLWDDEHCIWLLMSTLGSVPLIQNGVFDGLDSIVLPFENINVNIHFAFTTSHIAVIPSNSMGLLVMMSSSNGNIFRVTSALLCSGNTPVADEFPSQRPVTRSFDIFFYLCLNNRLSKQSRDWWYQAPLRPLWRHCNAIALFIPLSSQTEVWWKRTGVSYRK